MFVHPCVTPLSSVLTAPAVIFAAGCVPQEKYDDLLSAYRAKEQQVASARQETERMRANEASVRTQMQDYMDKLEQAELQMGGQNSEISDLRGRYELLLEQASDADIVFVNSTTSSSPVSDGELFGGLAAPPQQVGR